MIMDDPNLTWCQIDDKQIPTKINKYICYLYYFKYFKILSKKFQGYYFYTLSITSLKHCRCIYSSSASQPVGCNPKEVATP